MVDVDHPDLLCHILPTADHWLLISTLSESPDSGSGSEAGSGRQAVKETPVWEPSQCWRATPANYSSIYWRNHKIMICHNLSFILLIVFCCIEELKPCLHIISSARKRRTYLRLSKMSVTSLREISLMIFTLLRWEGISRLHETDYYNTIISYGSSSLVRRRISINIILLNSGRIFVVSIPKFAVQLVSSGD